MRYFPSETLRMMEGCKFEISYKKNGGIWYSAIIETKPPIKPKSRYRERCVRLLKDDFSTPLTGLTYKASFRPIPPKDFEARIDIKQGSIVDAYHKGGWWTGLVVKEIDDDKCLVFFDSLPDIIQFERKHLRPHFRWINEKMWLVQGPDAQFMRQLTEEPMFICGAMVEVSSKINISEVVWRPAMIVKEIEEDDEKKYIVKVCDNPLSFKGTNITVDLDRVRPRPSLCWVEEYQSGECVEAFHGTKWRQGRVVRGMLGFVTQKWYSVLLKVRKKEFGFKISDLRPLKVWEDGVWKMDDSLMNESCPALTPSPGMTTTRFKQEEAETQLKTFHNKTLSRNQNGLGNDSSQENVNSEDNNRKRKREENISFVTIVEENKANDTTIVLPFEKKLPIWKTVESMEIFKTVPQSPHFSPLEGTSKDSREVSAVGLMLTFSGLLEEVKDLQLDDPISSLTSLNDSFAELEKHGFDVEVPQLRITKLLSLRDKKAKNMEELKDAEKVTAEKERVKFENKRKILELQRLNEEADKEIAQSKTSAATIVQHLEDVELQFQATALAPW